MYSNLSLYYLNQLGIKPWINKEAYYHSVQQKEEFEQQTVKLVVFSSSNIDGKVGLLLKRMIAYLAIDEENLLSIKLDKQETSNVQQADWYSLLQKQIPQVILAFGVNPADLIAGLQMNCPLITSLAPEYLLSHPSDKKKVLHDLLTIKQILDN